MFKNRTILITGGTGSWGQELTRRLLAHRPKQIRIFSRSESAQTAMRRSFSEHPSLSFIIGDVRDFTAVWEACRNADYVFHLAALKHVPICEAQPEEAIKTNIIGTQNVITASIMHRVSKVIDVSTDKAADPINVYGLTKAVGEKLIVKAGLSNKFTRFVCIRGGNVLGSSGSVVPIFCEQIAKGKDITITSPKMTRFFLTIEDAVGLVLKAAQIGIGGETFVMRMNACRMIDLADILIRHLAAAPVRLKEIGIRPGEKIHEVLITSNESPRTYWFNDQHFVLLPSEPSPELRRRYQKLRKVSFETYASDANLLSDGEIEHMLRKGGFIK